VIRRKVDALSPLEKLTLLLLAAPSSGNRTREPIPGRTHLAKELFLLWKNPIFSNSLRTVRFEPGRFGPWTEAIAVALDELRFRDLIRQSAGKSSLLALTDRGTSLAEDLWTAASPAERAILTDIKTNLNSLSTGALLNRIYSAYPEFAVASEWRGGPNK
jgi:hypothetical protein